MTKAVTLSANGAKRVLEMQGRRNRGKRQYTFDEMVEHAIRLQYNRERSVRRHSMSLKDEVLEVSTLEERGSRGLDDE